MEHEQQGKPGELRACRDCPYFELYEFILSKRQELSEGLSPCETWIALGKRIVQRGNEMVAYYEAKREEGLRNDKNK